MARAVCVAAAGGDGGMLWCPAEVEEEEAAPPPSLQPAVCHRTPSPAHRSYELNMLIHAYAYSDISVACECYFCTNQPHKTQLIEQAQATFDAQMFSHQTKSSQVTI